MNELDLTLAKIGNERYEIAKRNERARNYSAQKRRTKRMKIKSTIETTLLACAMCFTPILMFLYWLHFGY